MKLQKVSLDHIAKLAGVHKATVSRALRNHPTIPKSTRDRIQQIAQHEGYKPHPLVAMYQAQTRANRPSTMQATLAWINDYPNAASWQQYPWLKGFLAGARMRCEQRGFRLDEIQVSSDLAVSHSQEVQSASRILRARGIYGIVLPLMLNHQYLIETWENCAVALVGSGHTKPVAGRNAIQEMFYPQNFPSADRDLYFNMRLAFQTLLQRGYNRVGFIYSRYLDIEAGGQAHAAYLFEQASLPEANRLPILFLDKFKEGRPPVFDQWLENHKPDVILCINPMIKKWISELGMDVPKDIGLANLNLVQDIMGWSGIDEQHEHIGAAAVDLLIGQLSRNEIGQQRNARKILIPGAWVEGQTLRPPPAESDPETPAATTVS